MSGFLSIDGFGTLLQVSLVDHYRYKGLSGVPAFASIGQSIPLWHRRYFRTLPTVGMFVVFWAFFEYEGRGGLSILGIHPGH